MARDRVVLESRAAVIDVRWQTKVCFRMFTAACPALTRGYSVPESATYHAKAARHFLFNSQELGPFIDPNLPTGASFAT
jgi:hypothetical protein